MSTQEKVLDLIFGRWRSQILYAGVKLGIFDALGAGPKTAAVTAHELGLDPALAYRLLRGKARVRLLFLDNLHRTPSGSMLKERRSSGNLTTRLRGTGSVCMKIRFTLPI